MKASEILIKAKSLITDPAKWKKGTATTSYSYPCCALNAVGRASPDSHSDSGRYAWNTAGKKLEQVVTNRVGNPFVGEYNDDPKTTHADIMSMFDEAIALALADEKENETKSGGIY